MYCIRLCGRYGVEGGDAIYGNASIAEPTGDKEFGPLFFAEVEYGKCSLLEFIRHLGMLLASFPISTVFWESRA